MLQEYIDRSYRQDRRPSVEANTIRDNAAIVGVGQTEYTRNSGRDELDMACEAIRNAVDDAGLTMADIDGLEAFTLPAFIVAVGYERTEVPPEQMVRNDFLQLCAGHSGMNRQTSFVKRENGHTTRERSDVRTQNLHGRADLSSQIARKRNQKRFNMMASS